MAIGRVELENRFNPTQRFVLLVPHETSDLSGHARADRLQS
jgi:hypothetical protein